MSQQPSKDSLDMVARYFTALSDTNRLLILTALKKKPLSVKQLIEATGLGQANISKHLGVLANLGIVTCVASGRLRIYQVSHPSIFSMFKSAQKSILADLQARSDSLAIIES